MNKDISFGEVTFLPGRNKGRYPCCHSVYLPGSKILIDPACDRERLEALKSGEGVEQVWLTHWHEDHISNLDLFDDRPLFMCEKDAPPLADLEVFLDWYRMDGEQVREYWREAMVKRFHYKPRKPDGFLKEGQEIKLKDLTVRVMETPGHTPGSLSFLFMEPGVLFMADYDLTKFGPWYGELHASIADVFQSIERLKSLPARVWLTGHETGVFTEQPGQKWDDYAQVVHDRQKRLQQVLSQPRTFKEIVESWVVYRKAREPKELYYVAEAAMIKKHLEWMREEGRLQEQDGLIGLTN